MSGHLNAADQKVLESLLNSADLVAPPPTPPQHDGGSHHQQSNEDSIQAFCQYIAGVERMEVEQTSSAVFGSQHADGSIMEEIVKQTPGCVDLQHEVHQFNVDPTAYGCNTHIGMEEITSSDIPNGACGFEPSRRHLAGTNVNQPHNISFQEDYLSSGAISCSMPECFDPPSKDDGLPHQYRLNETRLTPIDRCDLGSSSSQHDQRQQQCFQDSGYVLSQQCETHQDSSHHCMDGVSHQVVDNLSPHRPAFQRSSSAYFHMHGFDPDFASNGGISEMTDIQAAHQKLPPHPVDYPLHACSSLLQSTNKHVDFAQIRSDDDFKDIPKLSHVKQATHDPVFAQTGQFLTSHINDHCFTQAVPDDTVTYPDSIPDLSHAVYSEHNSEAFKARELTSCQNDSSMHLLDDIVLRSSQLGISLDQHVHVCLAESSLQHAYHGLLSSSVDSHQIQRSCVCCTQSAFSVSHPFLVPSTCASVIVPIQQTAALLPANVHNEHMFHTHSHLLHLQSVEESLSTNFDILDDDLQALSGASPYQAPDKLLHSRREQCEGGLYSVLQADGLSGVFDVHGKQTLHANSLYPVISSELIGVSDYSDRPLYSCSSTNYVSTLPCCGAQSSQTLLSPSGIAHKTVEFVKYTFQSLGGSCEHGNQPDDLFKEVSPLTSNDCDTHTLNAQPCQFSIGSSAPGTSQFERPAEIAAQPFSGYMPSTLTTQSSAYDHFPILSQSTFIRRTSATDAFCADSVWHAARLDLLHDTPQSDVKIPTLLSDVHFVMNEPSWPMSIGVVENKFSEPDTRISGQVLTVPDINPAIVNIQSVCPSGIDDGAILHRNWMTDGEMHASRLQSHIWTNQAGRCLVHEASVLVTTCPQGVSHGCLQFTGSHQSSCNASHDWTCLSSSGIISSHHLATVLTDSNAGFHTHGLQPFPEPHVLQPFPEPHVLQPFPEPHVLHSFTDTQKVQSGKQMQENDNTCTTTSQSDRCAGNRPDGSQQVPNPDQTNTALTLLSTVLKQIQALLPHTVEKQPLSNSICEPGRPSSVMDASASLAELLLQQTDNSQYILNLLQQQHLCQPSSLVTSAALSTQSLLQFSSQTQHQLQARAMQHPPICHQQEAVLPAVQQPNFLLQHNHHAQPVVPVDTCATSLAPMPESKQPMVVQCQQRTKKPDRTKTLNTATVHEHCQQLTHGSLYVMTGVQSIQPTSSSFHTPTGGGQFALALGPDGQVLLVHQSVQVPAIQPSLVNTRPAVLQTGNHDSCDIGGMVTSSLSCIATSSLPVMVASSLPGMAVSSLPVMAASSLPGMAASSLPGMAVSSLPGMAVNSLPGMAASSLPGMAVSSLPGMAAISLPSMAFSSLPVSMERQAAGPLPVDLHNVCLSLFTHSSDAVFFSVTSVVSNRWLEPSALNAGVTTETPALSPPPRQVKISPELKLSTLLSPATTLVCLSVEQALSSVSLLPAAGVSSIVRPIQHGAQPMSGVQPDFCASAHVSVNVVVLCSSQRPLLSKPFTLSSITTNSGVIMSTSTFRVQPIAGMFPADSSPPHDNAVRTPAPTGVATAATPVGIGNFLNVSTTGSAAVLLNALNAYRLASVDCRSEKTTFKTAFLTPNSFSDEPLTIANGGTVSSDSDMEVVEPVGNMVGNLRQVDVDSPQAIRSSAGTPKKVSSDDELDHRTDCATGSMLRKMLTMKHEDSGGVSMMGSLPAADSLLEESLVSGFTEGSSQATLVERSAKLKLCSSELNVDEDTTHPEFWSPVPTFTTDNFEDSIIPPKVARGIYDLDASSKQVTVPSVEKLFDAGGANAVFVFTKFGADVPIDSGVCKFGVCEAGVTTAGTTAILIDSCLVSGADVSRNPMGNRMSSPPVGAKCVDIITVSGLPSPSIRHGARRQRDHGLSFQYPCKFCDYELCILTQPEQQHRARYLTEGSRGAVKDRSQQGYPVIKLSGYNEPAILQVYIGSEIGRVKPHGFYQACRVFGKNSTPCVEREIDGTSVIEIELSPANHMLVNLDCVGILKLRNADVEKRLGPVKAKARKRNSTKARLVCRCCLAKPDGSRVILQTASTSILCTQPIGQPEISRISLSEICVDQVSDLFLIGKNFMKGTQILFQEMGCDESDVKWQSHADIEVEFFQQNHVICRVPAYPDKGIDRPVVCRIVAQCEGKLSDPLDFVYRPASANCKDASSMEVDPFIFARPLPFASTVALQVNQILELNHNRHQTCTTSPGSTPQLNVTSSLATSTVTITAAMETDCGVIGISSSHIFQTGKITSSAHIPASVPVPWSLCQPVIVPGTPPVPSYGVISAGLNPLLPSSDILRRLLPVHPVLSSSLAPSHDVRLTSASTVGTQQPKQAFLLPAGLTRLTTSAGPHTASAGWAGSAAAVRAHPPLSSCLQAVLMVSGLPGQRALHHNTIISSPARSLIPAMAAPLHDVSCAMSPTILILPGTQQVAATPTCTSTDASQVLCDTTGPDSLLKQILEPSAYRGVSGQSL